MSETATNTQAETKVETAPAAETKATTTVVNKKKGMTAKDLTALGLLTGILLVMSFTPLGYFHTFGLDISLMMIPVGIGAMLLGPKAGAWLGFIFGATSFYQAMNCPHIDNSRRCRKLSIEAVPYSHHPKGCLQTTQIRANQPVLPAWPADAKTDYYD